MDPKSEWTTINDNKLPFGWDADHQSTPRPRGCRSCAGWDAQLSATGATVPGPSWGGCEALWRWGAPLRLVESGAGQNSIETYGLGLMMNDGHDDDDDDEEDAPCLFALGLIRGLGRASVVCHLAPRVRGNLHGIFYCQVRLLEYNSPFPHLNFSLLLF